ncbi:MAG: AMP-binding protein [Bdellovibrionaceae bacterium]|nr:AMP-binding protein [Pseudobdellovibrionaceae bacterium]
MLGTPLNFEVFLLQDLIHRSAINTPQAIALVSEEQCLTYQQLNDFVNSVAQGFSDLGVKRLVRVGIFLEKCPEFVIAAFATAKVGGVFVPINPMLKSSQILHILNDCNVEVLITSTERLPIVESVFSHCNNLKTIVLKGSEEATTHVQKKFVRWASLAKSMSYNGQHFGIDSDVVSIFYTSGSTGRPKGVVLSHRNMVMGARSVASYLENNQNDILLAALPFSFDAGFSQLTTGFFSGARIVLENYLTPHDLQRSIISHSITGITAVPPLYMQLITIDWPKSVSGHLRYFANTGGKMPGEVLKKLRSIFPDSTPYLMYGLTEAFRATFLDPSQVDKRPDSIGKSIPNSEVLVLNEAGAECGPGEVGELVQRGALVSLGYWNDEARRGKPRSFMGSGGPFVGLI